MKQLKIFLFVCIAQVATTYGMETEQQSLWYSVPEENITQIVACSDLKAKENLRSVNKQLYLIACKNKIESMLYHFPCILTRQDHLECMVKYAKKDNKDMVLRLIKTAVYCDHADWLNVVPYFLPEDAHELVWLKECVDYSNEKAMARIMAVYGGNKKELEQYKNNNYMKIQMYQDSYNHYSKRRHLELEEYKDTITPLHIATHSNHPVSIAQLLLIQDPNLLNAEDYFQETPLFGAVRSNAVEMCKFLLSCKNINPNKENHIQSIPLLHATIGGCLEIVILLVNYNNAHNIQLVDYPFSPWAQQIKHNEEAIRRFLLDPVNCQILDLKSALRFECRYHSIYTLKIFFEFYHDKIDINFQYNTDYNFTLLHYAAQRSHPDLVRLLLDHGANPDIADADGEKPIHLTSRNDIREMLWAKMK